MRSLGVPVVAEDVQNEQQLDRLRELGCDTMQGFLFAKPGPAGTVAALLSEHAARMPSAA